MAKDESEVMKMEEEERGGREEGELSEWTAKMRRGRRSGVGWSLVACCCCDRDRGDAEQYTPSSVWTDCARRDGGSMGEGMMQRSEKRRRRRRCEEETRSAIGAANGDLLRLRVCHDDVVHSIFHRVEHIAELLMSCRDVA